MLQPKEASYYHSLIGTMRRVVKIGDIDIKTEVSLLLSHSAMPRQGHLEAVLHIMGYLKLRNNSRLAFNTSCPDVNQNIFQECDWTDFYEDAVEVVPPNVSPPIRKEVNLCLLLDNDHADNRETRRSRIRFMIYMNMSLVNWNSKKQSSHSECIACHLI